ncbi:DUF5107 domain-containing protein [Xylanimonas ulmi]|uniref:Cytochrome c-type biogenesis protein CcmH/NrfG n=1 Tax=Xylanimonas ulmi TaxID=228973 RepID=A0A4Q7LZD1_9MICO|nr:DUF5107 domain-containing protein [Xylanibacterium ulmi]RZS60756.1 cytochrome c-type biogenesis protein CcmH/NrfG [Xylanibacterium ulmi]
MLNDESFLDLPDRPASLAAAPVAAWRRPVTIDTYLPDPPDRYPAYLDHRVYQGSSGRIYPLPFHEHVSPAKRPHAWDAIHLENEYIRLLVLPELGGRIHAGVDRTNGYDFFYRNNVIKPALVGLAGPWISGGVEFNWPQHHRPATFLPTDAAIEYEEDGSVTVWCSDHDPFARMKGMHGVRLRPGSNVVEVRVRLFNRTEDVQTFMWWANVAVATDGDYESFFPTDVRMVADHAKRAVTAFPRADRPYYGVDYPALADAEHPDADRIDRYRNIPVPTSYMALGTSDDFFGGYDHSRSAGLVHWADHQIAPGKKQWTWGDAPFGHAWDANLTDTDGPYVELMAGVYTDNQPDFSYLAPGETKTFSQYWYPLRDTGPVQQATVDAAVALDIAPGRDGTHVRIAVALTRDRGVVDVEFRGPEGTGAVWTVGGGPAQPIVIEHDVPATLAPQDVTVVVRDGAAELVRWTPRPVPDDVPDAEPATEPPAPEDIASVEELYLTGLHLEQYRHATRDPEPYWLAALARDPQDVRTNVALATRRYRAARYGEAEQLLRTAVGRLTRRNPNPYDGEAYYRLGQVLARQGRTSDADEAYGKAAWNAAWVVPARLAQARLAAARGDDAVALAHAESVLARDNQHLQARDLMALLLARTGRADAAAALLAATVALDPLDWWARSLRGEQVGADAPTVLDVALEHIAAGDDEAGLDLLARAASQPRVPGQVGVAPLAHYHRADVLARVGRTDEAAVALRAAHDADPTHCLPSRLDDVDMLERTVASHPDDARAWALLGHWRYAARRHADAVAAWQRADALDGTDPVVVRNLAVAAVNVADDPDLGARLYARARTLAPDDARLLYEQDQLSRRAAVPAAQRLAALRERPDLVRQRDDLSVQLAVLLTAEGEAEAARDLLAGRRFQPWEGGEGQVLAAWDDAQLALARDALVRGDAAAAVAAVDAALAPPSSLGEARHPLANAAHLLLASGDARAAAGDHAGATAAWQAAASRAGDFQEMAATPFSEATYSSVLAARRLAAADGSYREVIERLVRGLDEHVDLLAALPATVDYFATSLPTMLLFTDDVQGRRDTTVLLLRAQLAALRDDDAAALDLVAQVLRHDPTNSTGLDLLRQVGVPSSALRTEHALEGGEVVLH